ncbi:hypothetical protein [Petrachloros mirabilis]
MSPERSEETSQFRITLFVGPQTVEGKPSIQYTVFNVKKRSWKAGIQVAVEIDQRQIDRLRISNRFPEWLDEVISAVPSEFNAANRERALELFIQAISRCKLELLLQAGITQESQCLPSDTFVAELDRAVASRQTYVRSFVSTELDLVPNDNSSTSL